MKKLFEYSEKIMPTLYSVLDENGKTALKNMFGNSTKSPKVGQMMALYLLTGGNTELGAMNT